MTSKWKNKDFFFVTVCYIFTSMTKKYYRYTRQIFIINKNKTINGYMKYILQILQIRLEQQVFTLVKPLRHQVSFTVTV